MGYDDKRVALLAAVLACKQGTNIPEDRFVFAMANAYLRFLQGEEE